MESSIIENYKNDELVHFYKINIFGETGVGKTSLISLLENYDDDNYIIKNVLNKYKDNCNESSDSESESLSMIEPIKRVVIDFNDDRNLYFNLYEIDLNNYDSIKMNLDTLLYKTECIIIMWDSNNPETLDNIPNFISTIEAGIEQFKFEKVPIFVIQNKIDIDTSNNNGEIIKSIKKIKNNKKITYVEISLYNKDDFYKLLLEVYRKMEIYDKETLKNTYKFKNSAFYQIKIQYPLKNILNKASNDINDINNAMKLLLLGDPKTGKSSFMNNLLGDKSNNNINIIFPAKIFGNKTKIIIIEESRVNNLYESNYKNADGILLFIDLTNEEGLNKIDDWIFSIKNNFGEINDSYELFLIGNKLDEKEKREIYKKDAINLAEKYQIKYLECSSLKGLNNYEILNEMILLSFNKFNNKNKNIIESKIESSCSNENDRQGEKEEEKEKKEKKEINEEKGEKSPKLLQKKIISKNNDNKKCSNIINKNLDINDNEYQKINDFINNKKGNCKKKLIEIIMIILYIIIYIVVTQYFI